jgi:hypothetical protein
MSEDETPTPKKPDYQALMKFKLNQVVEYNGQQCIILGWSTNGDGDRNTGVGTSFKYKLDKVSVLVQEKDILASIAKAAASSENTPAAS